MWNADLIRRRLAEIERRDPEHKRFGACRHHYRLGQKLSEREVAKLEMKAGIHLPDSFRTFLTRVGNGGAGPDYGLYTVEEALRQAAMEEYECPNFLTTTFPHTEDWRPPFGNQPDGFPESYWITGSLILAEHGCGGFHRLVVNGQRAGEVWLDDRGASGVFRERDFREWYTTWLEQPDTNSFRIASGGGAPAPG